MKSLLDFACREKGGDSLMVVWSVILEQVDNLHSSSIPLDLGGFMCAGCWILLKATNQFRIYFRITSYFTHFKSWNCGKIPIVAVSPPLGLLTYGLLALSSLSTSTSRDDPVNLIGDRWKSEECPLPSLSVAAWLLQEVSAVHAHRTIYLHPSESISPTQCGFKRMGGS